MELKDLVRIHEELQKEKRKKGRINILKNFLLTLKDDEIEASINLLLGKIPKVNIGYSTISKSISKNVSPFLKISKDVKEIYNHIMSLKTIKSKKDRIISSLFSQLTEKERIFLANSLLHEMRHGVEDGLMLDAVAATWNIDREKIERAYLFSSIPEIVKYAKNRELGKLKIKLYKPIKPMLADVVNFEDLNGWYAIEYKFDGIRIHAHIGDKIKIFSRNLRDITNFLPEIVDELSSIDNEVILDGEIIAFDKKPLPFQYLMRKFRLKNEINVPLKLYIFDILYLNGKELIDLEYRKRWDLLKDIAKDFLPPHIETKEQNEIRKFFEKAIKDGHEGIVAKELKSKYRIRKGWYKIKKSYTLDLTIIAAEWGHGRRHRWLSDYWLAVSHKGKYHMVGKTFKGLTDEEFEEMTKILLKNKIREEGRIIFVRPYVVVEVEFDDVQKSSKYGYALRFARIKRIRWDKNIEEINNLEDVKKIYEMLHSNH